MVVTLSRKTHWYLIAAMHVATSQLSGLNYPTARYFFSLIKKKACMNPEHLRPSGVSSKIQPHVILYHFFTFLKMFFVVKSGGNIKYRWLYRCLRSAKHGSKYSRKSFQLTPENDLLSLLLWMRNGHKRLSHLPKSHTRSEHVSLALVLLIPHPCSLLARSTPNSVTMWDT